MTTRTQPILGSQTAMILIVLLLLNGNTQGQEQQRFRIASQAVISDTMNRENHLRLEQQLSTAMDYPVAIRRFSRGCRLLHYSIQQRPNVSIMSPVWVPHLIKKNRFYPILKVSHPLTLFIAFNKGQEFSEYSDFSGKSIATTDFGFSINIYLKQKLEQETRDNPAQMITLSDHSNTLLSLLDGTVDAALLSESAYQQLPAAVKQQLGVFRRQTNIPSAILIASKESDPLQIQRYSEYLQSISFKDWGVPIRYSAVSEEDIENIRQVFGQPSVEQQCGDGSEYLTQP